MNSFFVRGILRCLLRFLAIASLLMLCHCGISHYPGQPGVVTNGYSKIHLEYLDSDGLWVYEVSYDNRRGQKGVGAIVSKLYLGAEKFTSNIRESADDTLYRVKTEYKGATVQMISVPSIKQIMFPPNSHVGIMLSYLKSLNEVDDRNLAEETLFKKNRKVALPTVLSQLNPLAEMENRFRFDLIKAAKLTRQGNLAFEVEAIKFGEKKLTVEKPFGVELDLSQSGIRAKGEKDAIKAVANFVETNFATGYLGSVNVFLKDTTEPLNIVLGLHTEKTAEAAGITIVKNASSELIQRTLKTYEIQ